MPKPWKDMNREELLAERARWEANLQRTNLQLAAVRRRGAAGDCADADSYQALMEERVRLASGLRGVSAQLSKFKVASAQAHPLDTAFRKVAKLILEEDLYEEILEGAQDMVGSGESLAGQP